MYFTPPHFLWRMYKNIIQAEPAPIESRDLTFKVKYPRCIRIQR